MAEPEVIEVLRKIRYDLTAAQTKLTEALRMLAAMDLPTEPEGTPCPRCRLPIRGERALAFHIQNVHDGPPVPLDEAELIA